MADQYKDSLLKMASTAISASKTGWSRARQFTEERIGSAERTEYGAQFDNSLAQAERTRVLTDKLLTNFQAVLQPNPGIRMEEFFYNQLDKKTPLRPTNPFALGQVMQEGGHDIGPGTAYGSTLSKVGNCMKKVGNAEKDFMQTSMTTVMQPLRSSLDNEMRTIAKEKRALEAKRLDLDACKTRAKKSATADKMRQAEIELRQAQAEYDRQYEVTKLLLDGISTSHQNHLVAVQSFVEALGQYHSQCQQYVAELQSELQMSTAPSVRHTASPVNGSTASAPVEKKRARVLQDYDASDRSELSLIEGEVVNVYHDDTLNDGWIMAERGGQKGKVPLIYLELQ